MLTLRTVVEQQASTCAQHLSFWAGRANVTHGCPVLEDPDLGLHLVALHRAVTAFQNDIETIEKTLLLHIGGVKPALPGEKPVSSGRAPRTASPGSKSNAPSHKRVRTKRK